MHASLSNASLVNVTSDDGHKRVQLFPERKDRQAYEGYYDAGGGAFQSEPAAQFVRRSLQAGQSIYWNPYSATGSYGPETLVDIKTSPVSMLNAILNGGDLASHVVFLGFNLLAVFCLLVLFTIEFRLSFVAALAGGVTFLLNGYYVANLGSNVSQVWLYFPVLTLALVSFARRPSTLKLVGIALAAILVLATTFLPTMVLALEPHCWLGRPLRSDIRWRKSKVCVPYPAPPPDYWRATGRRVAGAVDARDPLPACCRGSEIHGDRRFLRSPPVLSRISFQPDFTLHAKACLRSLQRHYSARRSDAGQCRIPSRNYRRLARKPGRAAVANPSADRHWCRGRRAPGVRCANLRTACCHPDCGCASRPGKPWRAVSLDLRRPALHDHRSVWFARLAGERAKAAPVAGHHGRDRIGARVHDDIVWPEERRLRSLSLGCGVYPGRRRGADSHETEPTRSGRPSRYVSLFSRGANSHSMWITPDCSDTTAFPIRRLLSASCKSRPASTGLRVTGRRAFRPNTAVHLVCTRSGR